MPDNNRNNDHLIPAADAALRALKLDVARQVGWDARNEATLQAQFDQYKHQVAAQKGIPFRTDYNGDLPSRLNGAVGGPLGGRIGGQMVRRMIALAEQTLSGSASPTAQTGPAAQTGQPAPGATPSPVPALPVRPDPSAESSRLLPQLR